MRIMPLIQWLQHRKKLVFNLYTAAQRCIGAYVVIATRNQNCRVAPFATPRSQIIIRNHIIQEQSYLVPRGFRGTVMSSLKESPERRQYKRVANLSRKDPEAPLFDAILAREQRTREAMVAVEETKLLAEKLKECYRKEGVNHFVKCEQIARAYMKRISTPGFQDSPVEMSDIQ